MDLRLGAFFVQENKRTFLDWMRRVTVLLSLVVVLGVFWSLKLTGLTLAGEAFCGKQEHIHEESCLSALLSCGMTESPGHIHDESCILRICDCNLEEIPTHVHGAECLLWETVCTLEESEGHTHSESCYERLLLCSEQEREGHTHGEACFTPKLTCTITEDADHVHTDQCSELVLSCPMEETLGHLHGEACWTLGEEPLCGLEESEGHTHAEGCHILREDSYICDLQETEGHSHTDLCFRLGVGFGCGLTEAEGHIHTAECITEQTELGCGQEAIPAHAHTESCYTTPETCPLEAHIHTESCYSDITADLETELDRKNSLGQIPVELTTGERLIAVARSQLGYTESELNFEVDLQGVRRGITRYGQWYGNPYGDWSAMFVSFCLHYAGIKDLPSNAGPESMRLEWEAAGMYADAGTHEPRIGNLIFLRADRTGPEGELMDADQADPEALQREIPNTAAAVGIICDVSESGITLIQGNLNDTVLERIIDLHDPSIIGYGLVPERSPYAVMLAPAADMALVARPINYANNVFSNGRQFLLYVRLDGICYAIDGNANAVPIRVENDGIYAEDGLQESLLWTFTKSNDGNNRYVIRNMATGLYLHPYHNSTSDFGIINQNGWSTPVQQSGTGVRFIHSASARLNPAGTAFDITRNQNEASVFELGVVEQCTVWFDGTGGGVDSLLGARNESYTVTAPSPLKLPEQWYSPPKYSYTLRGWYDVTHDKYYAPGEIVTVTENTVFYADWMASTYDIGVYNALVADTVSTNSFITTRLYDYNYLFNVLSADSTGSISANSHSETWNIVRNETVDYENRESLNFIFLDYRGDAGPLDYPNNRQDGVNQYPGDGIVTGGIYNSDIGEALFSTGDNIPGKVYLGTGDHLFQIMTDPDDPYYGYYYYDSSKNAASYNRSAQRFYVYDYLEATNADLSATKSDFLPLNSPYANTNGMQAGTYRPNGKPSDLISYVYDAKYADSQNRVATNYAFGMKSEIRFYLPNKPGEDGNHDLYGNDMRFYFSGDDDLWVLIDGKLALDIGGIHQAETGEINFSTGEVLVQGKRNNALSNVIANLEPGEHTLTLMYLERGASHSNCAIYFNLAPRFHLDIQKEDVLTRDVLNGAQFSVYRDLDCTIPAELWTSQQSYLNGDPATNVFSVTNGSARMWGMGAGNTYYIKETRPPDNADYGFPNGVIRMVLDKKGAATYSVMIIDAGDGISGGFTVHGFRVDDETQQAYIIATNAPKWVQEVTSVEARKVWADGKDHAGESVTIYLTVHHPDGTVLRLQEAVLNEETDWQHLWENLPKTYEDGTPIVYGVEEAYVPGYYSKVEQVDSYGVTTVKWEEVTSLEDGKIYLLKNGNNYLSTRNRDEDTGFMWVKDEATAKSSDLAQWKVTKLGNGYKLTNLAGQAITLYYNNGSPTDFYAYSGNNLPSQATQQLSYRVSGKQVRIYYDAPNNRDYYIKNQLNNSQKFQVTTSEREGQLFTLLTQRTTTTSGPVQGDIAYKITNTKLDKETSLRVRKEWYNHLGDDKTLYEQAQVTIKLLANGKDSGRTVTLSLKNGWTDVFQGLPYQDSNGNVIEYTIEESWYSKDWLPEYGPIVSSGGTVPTYDTTVTNVYRWGHGVELPSTGSPARMLYILCGSSIMLATLVYGFVSRRKRERRMK